MIELAQQKSREYDSRDFYDVNNGLVRGYQQLSISWLIV